MKTLWQKARRFLVSKEGPTAVEYAVLLAMILMVCFAAIVGFGQKTQTSLSNSANSISQAVN